MQPRLPESEVVSGQITLTAEAASEPPSGGSLGLRPSDPSSAADTTPQHSVSFPPPPWPPGVSGSLAQRPPTAHFGRQNLTPSGVQGPRPEVRSTIRVNFIVGISASQRPGGTSRAPGRDRTVCDSGGEESYQSSAGRSSSQGLSLNRSQFGGCSTKYNTPAGT